MILLVSLALAKPAATFVWNWRDGLDRTVRIDVREVVQTGAEARRRCASVSWRERSARVEEGLRIWVEEVKEEVPGSECPSYAELSPFVPPPFVVAENGEIVAVEGSADDARVVREEWNRTVGYWNRTEFTRKEARSVRVRRALPSLGWEPNDVQVTGSYEGPAGCKGECSAVALSFAPDDSDVTAYFVALHAAAPQLGGTVGAASLLEAMALETGTATLLPRHRLDTLRVVVSMTEPPGKATRTVETEWTWEDRGSKE